MNTNTTLHISFGGPNISLYPSS